ncbi:MAG: hypothetical protein LLG01_09040 [Planctomycetaceae bacterium]|nr:hypothetical protein [Planctomycetaceae bacterium]
MTAIDFSHERRLRLDEASEAWWAGTLDRPMISATLYGRDPGRKPPMFQGDLLAAAYDLSVPAEDIVDAWDYALCCQEFLGDASPMLWVNMGAISSCAYFGAVPQVQAAEGTVWFHPPRDLPPMELHFMPDAANVWLKRALELCRAAADRWQGQVAIGMPGLVTGLDIVSVFRPGEKLLLDLLDEPAHVLRCVDEIREAFWTWYDDFCRASAADRCSYTCWIPMFSTKPFYAFQCDAAYMISPEMFDCFVRPDLEACCGRIPHSIYHLDGIGQLPHLDSLLNISSLSAIQWVPGAGKPDQSHWPDVYRRIHAAGKKSQLFGGFEVLDAIADQTGTAANQWLITGGHTSQRDEILKVLARYGAA